MQILKPENKKNSPLPLFAVGTFGLNLLTLILLVFHGSILKDLDKQLTPQSLVQLLDGQSITVDPKPNLERDPETIRRFVGETITLLLSWSPQQSKIATLEASTQLFSDNFRQKIQSEVENLVSINQLENSSKLTENILVIERVSQPVKIGEGKWKVEITANQLIFSNYDSLGKSVSFNKQVLVRAIDNQAVVLPDAPVPVSLQVYRIGEARLQIYNICTIENRNCN
jgi:hypothetical protein